MISRAGIILGYPRYTHIRENTMTRKHGNEDDQVKDLENGNVYFFYRPRVGDEEPESVAEIQRLYMVLSPHGKQRYRLMVIGHKKLPDPSRSGQGRLWGFVDQVTDDPKAIERDLQAHRYSTKTRGEQVLPAARPAGEGVYRIIRHDSHTHLVYALELPEEPDEVQEALNIEAEANYILSIKNPTKASSRDAGFAGQKAAKYPQRLMQMFRDRQFSEADPIDLLDYPHAQFMMIAVAEDVSDDLGIELHPQYETEATAEIINDLKMEKSKHPLEPLFEGKWA
jgi:hypothetical protein